MDTATILFAFFLGATAFYGYTLALALLIKKNYNPRANFALAIIVICFASLLLEQAFTRSQMIEGFERFGLIFGSFWFIIFPSIFLHGCLTINPNRGFRWFDLFHLAPLALQLSFISFFYYGINVSDQTDWLSGSRESSFQSTFISTLYGFISKGHLFLGQVIIYLPAVLIVLSRFIARNQERLSSEGLNRIVYTRNTYVMVTVITILMESLLILKIQGDWSIFIMLTFTVVIYFLAYLSMSSPTSLYNQIPFKWSFRSRELPEEEVGLYLDLLMEQIDSKVYRDPELTLDKLAELIRLQPRQLSNLIKRKFNKAFPEFINDFRISEAKRLLEDPKHHHWSILAIGMEVGFNSKSTFNRVFKKTVGITPSEYLSRFRILG